MASFIDIGSIQKNGIDIGSIQAQLIAATLSSPTSNPFSTSAVLGCTTDIIIGTLYGVVDLAVNITAITAAQVIAGDNNGDVPAIGSNSAAVSTTTPSVFVGGLDPETLYSFALAQDNGLESNVVTGTFTTLEASLVDAFIHQNISAIIQPVIRPIIR